jgi:hypothetical protein
MEGLGLARKLGKKDRIAPRKTHRAAAPGAVRREQLAVGTRDRHIKLDERSPSAVTAGTLIRGEEGAGRGRAAAGHPGVVIGLGRHHQARRRRPRQRRRQHRRQMQRVGKRCAGHRRQRSGTMPGFVFDDFGQVGVRVVRRGCKEVLDQEGQELAWLALHVAQAGEGLIVARRGVADSAERPEAIQRGSVRRRRRLIGLPTLPAKHAPVPAVGRRCAVADHHRVALGVGAQSQHVVDPAGRGRRGGL